MPRYMQISVHPTSQELLKTILKPEEVQHTVLNGRVVYYVTLAQLKDYQALEQICHEHGILTFFIDSDN